MQRIKMNMKPNLICSQCQDYIDQNLSESQRSEFELHLEECNRCSQKLQQWQRLELEVIAAFGLFGSTGFCDELNSTTSDNADNILQQNGEGLMPGSKRTSDKESWFPGSRYVWWTTVATVFIAAMVGWNFVVKFSNVSLQSNSHSIHGPNEPAQGLVETDLSIQKQHLNQVSGVSVKVREPLIALVPVTTPRFTAVKVYPVFSSKQLDQAN